MIITVPMVPPSPNELRRKYRNPHTYRRLRKLWEDGLFYGASCSRHRSELTSQSANHRMRVEIRIYHSKEFDQDNLVGAVKPILDALKNIHFITNDDAQWLDLVPPTQHLAKRKEGRTQVAVTMIE